MKLRCIRGREDEELLIRITEEAAEFPSESTRQDDDDRMMIWLCSLLFLAIMTEKMNSFLSNMMRPS